MNPQISIRYALLLTMLFASVFAISKYKYVQYTRTDIYKLHTIRTQILTASEIRVSHRGFGYRFTNRKALLSLADPGLWPETCRFNDVKPIQSDGSELILLLVFQPGGDFVHFSLEAGYLYFENSKTEEPLPSVTRKIYELMEAERTNNRAVLRIDNDNFFGIENWLKDRVGSSIRRNT